MSISLRHLGVLCVFAIQAAAQVNVLTYRNDNARTGQNLNEPLLSPANVNDASFGRRFLQPVDGTVYAQPLYMAAVPIAGGAVHNIVVVVTEHDSVYAFDADDNLGTNAAPLWQVSYINPDQGVIPIPWGDVQCGVIYPEIGITGTPVIDPATYTMYFVASTKETATDGSVKYVHRLHALDVRSGKELAASPVEIKASVPGTGDGGTTVAFVPESYKQRAALLLANGVVYTAWSSHCDIGVYHGWILGYRADTLEQVSVFNDTPNGWGASFWGGGAGPAADANGNVFAVSANGTFDLNNAAPDLGDSLIKFGPDLSVTDYFTPFNQLLLANEDLDLGSSGALLLPPEAGSKAHPNLLMTGGKEGRLYLVDRDALGGFNTASDASALQSVLLSGSIYGPPAYFSGSVYIAAAADQPRAFPIADGEMSTTPSSSSFRTFPNPGSSLVVSAYGNKNGIVWAFELADGGGALHAFDATDLSKELFRGEVGNFIEFAVPTEADGKVYLGLYQFLAVYGLIPGTPGSIAAVVNAASFNGSIAPGSLISIFGSNLAQATAGALQIPLPISLADTSVTINGVRAPLLYVSAQQINAQVPPGTATGTATVTVTSSGATTSAGSFQVAAIAPEIFVGGTGRVLALNQDVTVNSPANPARAGSVVTIFLTGQGSFTDPSASIGNLAAGLTYAGPAPGTVGVAQMNMRVPALPPGDYALVVTTAGVQSNSGLISVD